MSLTNTDEAMFEALMNESDKKEEAEEEFEKEEQVDADQGDEFAGEVEENQRFSNELADLDFDDGEIIDQVDEGPVLEVLLPPLPQTPSYVEIRGEYDREFQGEGFNWQNDKFFQQYYQQDPYYYDPDQQNFGDAAYTAGYDQGYVDLPLTWGDNLGEGDEKKVSKIDAVPIDYEQVFWEEIMTIPEQEGVNALDVAAEIESVKDTSPSFFGHEELLRKDYESAEEYISNTTPVFERCPSIESFFQQGKGANVHLYLTPGQKMTSKDVRLDATIFDLKDAVSRYAHIHPDMLDLRLNHSLLTNTKTLADLGVKPHGKVRFTVEINKRMDHHNDVGVADMVLKIPDLNDAKLRYHPDTVRHVPVSIENGEGSGLLHLQRKVVIVHPTEKKPMIGGHKNKRSGLIYHNAATNTTPDLEEETGAERVEEVGELMCGTGMNQVVRRLKNPIKKSYSLK